VKRREFITLLGGAATAAWPLAVRAQRPQRMRRIGVLMGYPEGDADAQSLIAAFQEEFRKLGWQPDQNVSFEYRWAMSNVELMQRYAKELVALAPDLILSSGTPTTAALVQQTSTIPIVFTGVVDPRWLGFCREPGKAGAYRCINSTLDVAHRYSKRTFWSCRHPSFWNSSRNAATLDCASASPST
jgi:putative ABC transport system substrate-binding protein